MPTRYRHIIWDWNGTLLNDVDLSIDIANGILRRRHLPEMDRTRYHAVFDFPVRNYYAQLGLDMTDEAFREVSKEWIAEYDRRRWDAKLHVGVEALLDAVVAAGLTQSILSAYRHETLLEIVDHFDLRSRFVDVTGLDNIYAHSKAGLGRACIAKLGIPPAQVLLVGDTLHDFDVAAEIGVDCALVAQGHHPLDRLAARCENVFPDLPALATSLGLTVRRS